MGETGVVLSMAPTLIFVICEQLWQLRFVNILKVILMYIPVRNAGDGSPYAHMSPLLGT